MRSACAATSHVRLARGHDGEAAEQRVPVAAPHVREERDVEPPEDFRQALQRRKRGIADDSHDVVYAGVAVDESRAIAF